MRRFLLFAYTVALYVLSCCEARGQGAEEITIIKGGNNVATDTGPERLGYEPPQPLSFAAPKHTNAQGQTEDHFRTYDAILERLGDLAAQYSHVETGVLGTTLLGNQIHYLRITGGDPDKRPCGKPKPVVIVNGGIHAREWISPEMALRSAEHLAVNYNNDVRNEMLMNDLKYLVDNCAIYFIIVSNVDGFIYTQSGWNKMVKVSRSDATGGQIVDYRDGRLRRKNMRDRTDMSTAYSFYNASFPVDIGMPSTTYLNAELGVDLNRNYSEGFGNAHGMFPPSPIHGSESYHGSASGSEPVTQHLTQFILGLPRVRGVIDYHSYGEMVIYPETSSPPSKRDQTIAAAIVQIKNKITALGDASRYTLLAIPYADNQGISKQNGTLIEWAAMKIPGKPLSAAVELSPNANQTSDTFAGVGADGFIHPAIEQQNVTIWKSDAMGGYNGVVLTLPGIADTFNENMRGAAAFIRFATGPQAKKKLKVWKDDNDDGKISDAEIRYESQWIVNSDGTTASHIILKNEWIGQGTYRFLVTFDQQMWVPPNESDEPQDYDGNPAIPPTLQFHRKNDPTAPLHTVVNPGNLGWYLSRFLPDGTPGSEIYDFDSWEGSISLPNGASAVFDGREIEVRLQAVNLFGFKLDGNPATVVDWNEGWKNYEDQDGIEEPDTGGTDKTDIIKIDTKRPILRNVQVQ